MSSWDTLCLIGSLLTCNDNDKVLFIKAYSLKRTTIQGGAHIKPDQEMATGDTTASESAGEEAEEGADASDVKSEGHEQLLQGGAREKEHAAINGIDKKQRTDGLEKV